MRNAMLGFILVMAWTLLPGAGVAQDTNPCPLLPQTRLERFETNTGTVIIRATNPIGTVAANAGGLSVKCKEITDAGNGVRELGISVEIALGGRREDVLLIDYEELDSLISAIDYLNGIDWSVTSFPGFDAVYTTRSGFRIVAFGSRRTGAIEYAVRSARTNLPPLTLSRDQVGQLRSLIEQAKTKLESLRKAK